MDKVALATVEDDPKEKPLKREIELNKLNIFKKYKKEFLSYIVNPSNGIDPMIVEYISSKVLGSSIVNMLETLDDIIIYPDKIDDSKDLIDDIRQLQILKYKYNEKFDQGHFIIPDQYLL